MTNVEAILSSVQYEFRDGWHVFRSPIFEGLYVASRDYETAFNDVGPSIKALLGKNE